MTTVYVMACSVSVPERVGPYRIVLVHTTDSGAIPQGAPTIIQNMLTTRSNGGLSLKPFKVYDRRDRQRSFASITLAACEAAVAAAQEITAARAAKQLPR